MNGFSTGMTKDKLSIGILGVDRGCGATHLVLALGNYLASGVGRKTAVVELSGQDSIHALIRQTGNKKEELLGVSYYTKVRPGQIPELLNHGYEAYILDLGSDYRTAREEFLRCDKQIIIGSISPWRVAVYEQFLETMKQELSNSWEWLALFADRHDKREIQKRYKVNMLSVPFIENPFYLKRQDMAFIQKIL